jgi:hypothetical protein
MVPTSKYKTTFDCEKHCALIFEFYRMGADNYRHFANAQTVSKNLWAMLKGLRKRAGK